VIWTSLRTWLYQRAGADAVGSSIVLFGFAGQGEGEWFWEDFTIVLLTALVGISVNVGGGETRL
jgi:hypothetical protein